MTSKKDPQQTIDAKQARKEPSLHEEPEEVQQNPPVQDSEAVTRVKRSRLVQLSLVPELVPAANAAIRSCLFTTGVGTRAIFHDYTPIMTWHKNLTIRYKGEELRQDDCSLWIQLCKKAAANPHFRVSCSFYQLLKELKLTDTGPNRKKLREQLDRLFEGRLHITFGNVEYKGSILPEFAIDSTGKIVANLSITISKLLGIHAIRVVIEQGLHPRVLKDRTPRSDKLGFVKMGVDLPSLSLAIPGADEMRSPSGHGVPQVACRAAVDFFVFTPPPAPGWSWPWRRRFRLRSARRNTRRFPGARRRCPGNSRSCAANPSGWHR